MSEIKALDKMRELVADINAKEIVDHMQLYPSAVFDCKWLDSWHSEFNRIVESLEAEIADCYMLLPVDADGVPIRVGDELFNKNKPTDVYKVTAIADNGYIRIYHDTAHIHSSQCRHVKPRTLEDVLNDYAKDVYEHGRDMHDVEKYADEIRELLGGDAS